MDRPDKVKLLIHLVNLILQWNNIEYCPNELFTISGVVKGEQRSVST